MQDIQSATRNYLACLVVQPGWTSETEMYWDGIRLAPLVPLLPVFCILDNEIACPLNYQGPALSCYNVGNVSLAAWLVLSAEIKSRDSIPA